MSLFRREVSKSESQSSRPEPVAPIKRRQEKKEPRTMATLIADGNTIAGKVTGKNPLRIEGRFEGEVDLLSDVIVGETGQVEGNIVAHSIYIAGQVKGNVRGKTKVEISTSGRLLGDVTAPRVQLDEGAFFSGKVEMTLKSQRSSSEPKESAKPGQSGQAQKNQSKNRGRS